MAPPGGVSKDNVEMWRCENLKNLMESVAGLLTC
jgi:hypothetical protein